MKLHRLTVPVAATFGLVSAVALAANTLKVGAVFGLSGAQSTYGEESINGMEMALDDLKAKDPALASKITVVKEDEKSNPIDAALAVKKVLNVDKVDLVFGSVASSNTLAMGSAVIEAGKVQVTPASTNPEVTKKGDAVFRTCFIDPFQGSVLADFAVHRLNKKKAAILLDHKSDYSKGLAEAFTVAFKAAGGEVVANESYEAGKKDFKTQLTKIRAKHPEVLLVPGYYQEVGLIMKQAQQMGFKVTLLGGDGWDSPTLYELAGADAVKGNYFSTHFAPDDKDPRVQKFVKDYTARFHKAPGAMSASSYDGILVVADAFKRAGSNDPAALKKALSATKGFVGVAGTLSINAQRDAVKPAVILKTEGNKAVFEAKIEPGQANKSH
ncbi:MAG: ABC transporter substrate-binding protein [Proteobacteria bacterium]|nr:ABC transporter substrate-binding protein [Pseudomonadota bacterium]